ncbi:YciK family oxidoreductase [Candidatus Marithrix sp. Canyon 246]|uniref:YciK family oxidoreductase n=1 Tax=Candidatus Marithrix sp. Canyon 246 TaxID=1827136 RepID=UPI00084A0D8D|nr:YciK family oxidoreductase [Candidatus Marithrix sp. Canyon 246]
MSKLTDRIILVTGAGDGIGRAAAKTFAEHGATVILLGRTIKKLESLYDEIEQAGYPQAAIYPIDLEGATPHDYEQLANSLDKEFGKLDGLLHNAAILGTLTPLELYDINQWYKVMQINVNAPFLLTKACLNLMKRSSDASIIFTSSEVGRQGKAYWGAYSVSKFAIEGMMQILADELESNTKIRVNSINPGDVRTAMWAAAYPAKDSNTVPPPEKIMSQYLYLMTSDINGKALNAQD